MFWDELYYINATVINIIIGYLMHFLVSDYIVQSLIQ